MSNTTATTFAFTVTHTEMGDCGTYAARTETEALVKHYNDVGYGVGYDADADEATNLDALDIYSDADAIDMWQGYTVERA